jgi:hypothetical protein
MSSLSMVIFSPGPTLTRQSLNDHLHKTFYTLTTPTSWMRSLSDCDRKCTYFFGAKISSPTLTAIKTVMAF